MFFQKITMMIDDKSEHNNNLSNFKGGQFLFCIYNTMQFDSVKQDIFQGIFQNHEHGTYIVYNIKYYRPI